MDIASSAKRNKWQTFRS